MIPIRTMTPASGPRVIPAEIGEPEYFFREREEYALQSPATEYQLSVSANMARRDLPEKPTTLEEFAKPDYSGLRIFDPVLQCYVLKPKPPLPRVRRPRPSPSVYDAGSGDWYWITCRETGVSLRRIRAQTASAAQTAAGLYALSLKLPASAAYARRDDA